MIFVGYQGIGKSSVSNSDTRFIDLESNNFMIDDKRDENWYKVYCKIAHHLSQQGYKVFVSCHKVVRQELFKYFDIDDIYIIYPSLLLEKEWISRLQSRFSNDVSNKNLLALKRATDYFSEDIADLEKSPFNKIIITNTDYELTATINAFIKLKGGKL